jgi:hypothetical protein
LPGPGALGQGEEPLKSPFSLWQKDFCKRSYVAMITKREYVEYLISTFGNYTGTHLAEHLDDVSHDTISDYLWSERLTAGSLWELVSVLVEDSPEAFLIVDDSMQDKRYSHFIRIGEVKVQRAAHGLVREIGEFE